MVHSFFKRRDCIRKTKKVVIGDLIRIWDSPFSFFYMPSLCTTYFTHDLVSFSVNVINERENRKFFYQGMGSREQEK